MSPSLQATRSTSFSLVLLLALALVGLRPHSCAAATSAEATQKCRQQLKLLAEALGNYRQDHNGAFPSRLRDLCPKYVPDESLLRCPAAVQRGTAGTANPNLIVPGEGDGSVVGYTWEMSPEDPPGWDGQGFGMSFAKFKELQRKSLVGKHFPVIRCSHHGADTFLNLAVDGQIYESGLYWECNYVDQLPAMRLAPVLVELADQPMSALLQPRPAEAIDSMLNLRPWCNARFQDPWVMSDLKMEQFQPDQELGRGVMTNRGVGFDPAGIIQLNGKLNPAGDWHGFSRLAYPTAVKSITIQRSFRVMHVLGAVQFEDPFGTRVGTVEIHRTGSRPEKWTWRYGVDVLNYRVAPGEPGPQLESTVVAWTGRFVAPEVKQRP